MEEPPPKKRRLGQRQRLALQPQDQEDERPSELARFLLEEWAWGHISPQLVQQVATKASADMPGSVPKKLQKLAHLGGGYANKMSSAMFGMHTSHVCQPLLVDLQYKKKQVPLQKMLLPHELFNSIFENYNDVFQNILVGPPGGLEKFWETNINHPGMEGRPALVDLHKTLPLAMHGDGVPITGLGKIWSKTAWVYSWSSLLSDATTKDKQMFIGMVWDTLQGPNTMNTFHSILAWSFKHLQLGIWPSEDWKGQKYLYSFIVFCTVILWLGSNFVKLNTYIATCIPFFSSIDCQVCCRNFGACKGWNTTSFWVERSPLYTPGRHGLFFQCLKASKVAGQERLLHFMPGRFFWNQ